jgi:hypothetical protein
VTDEDPGEVRRSLSGDVLTEGDRPRGPLRGQRWARHRPLADARRRGRSGGVGGAVVHDPEHPSPPARWPARSIRGQGRADDLGGEANRVAGGVRVPPRSLVAAISGVPRAVQMAAASALRPRTAGPPSIFAGPDAASWFWCPRHGGAQPCPRTAGAKELTGDKPADWPLALCSGGYEHDPARMTITGRQPPTSGTWHG